ncbi:MAG: hypothetical protein AAGC73_02080 [Verrucomicrobiota bacterium]
MKCAVIILLCLVNLSFGSYRIFKNTEGRLIEAKVLSVEGEMITIERVDGREFTIPIASLSQLDIDYIDKTYIQPAKLAQREKAAAARKKKEQVEAIRAELSKKYPIDFTMSKKEAKEAFSQGYNHQKNRDFEKAVAAWASIPQRYEHYADARRRAGFNVLGRELGRWEEAILFLLDAYAVDPKDKKVLEDLGRAYQRLDDFENAKIYLMKADTKNAREALKEIEAVEATALR